MMPETLVRSVPKILLATEVLLMGAGKRFLSIGVLRKGKVVTSCMFANLRNLNETYE